MYIEGTQRLSKLRNDLPKACMSAYVLSTISDEQMSKCIKCCEMLTPTQDFLVIRGSCKVKKQN